MAEENARNASVARETSGLMLSLERTRAIEAAWRPGDQVADVTASTPTVLTGLALTALVAVLFCLWRRHRELGAIGAILSRWARGDLESGVPAIAARAGHRIAVALRRVRIRLSRAKAASESAREHLASIGCGAVLVDGAGRIVAANAAFENLVGVATIDLSGVELSSLLIGADDREGSLRGRDAPAEVEVITSSGDRIPALLSVATDSTAQVGSRTLCIVQETRRVHEVEARLHRINLRLWLFNEITRLALGARDLRTTLDHIVETITGAAGFAGAAVAIHDAREQTLTVSASRGFDRVVPGAKELRGRTGSLLWPVVAQREPMILHLWSDSLDLEDSLLGHIRGSVLGMFPMHAGDRVVGVLVLLSDRELESVETFGHEGAELSQHAAALIDQQIASEALQRTNEEVELARMAAEDANRAKSEFLANMSHEIRTPMTAILGFADLVDEDSGASPETREFVQTIRRSGEHLLSIVNDILDLSKIEAGRMTVERAECSILDVVREVVDMFQRRAADKSIRMSLIFVWPLPRRISSDSTRLRQVIANLVGNAVKFTESGEVRITVSRDAKEPRRIRCSVRDTGIGMSAGELADVFKPFTQADTSHTRRFGGTGLGLAISQRLAALLGGGISVRSRKGFGSTFTLTFDGGEIATADLVRSDADHARCVGSVTAVAPRPNRDGLGRVLLAEDGPDNQRLVSHLLRRAGADVDVVEDGQAAVDAALTAASAGQPFDVILMDMQMPILDGYSATRALRERGYRGAIVALTAHAMTGDREKCLAAGCNAFLTKPIDRRALIDCVRAHTTAVFEST
jgi:signal transduction histidine kinase/CheY-like chemotaxis protein